MFAERVYAATSRPRTYRDPEDVCFACEGKGWILGPRLSLTPRPAEPRMCRCCLGLASMGLFVVEAVAPLWRYQFRWESDEYCAAITQAGRVALWLAGSSLGITRVEAIYLPIIDNPQLPGTVICTATVRRRA